MKQSTRLRPSPKPASAGRTRQKQRTRQALLDAALALSKSGEPTTLEDVADKALVSRATAYRYFPSTEALMHAAYLDLVAPSSERTMARSQTYDDDPIEQIAQILKATNRRLLEDEFGIHVLERSFMQTWLDCPTDLRAPRAEHRMIHIDQMLDTLADRLDDTARARLRITLSMVLGVEAVLSMRDVAGAGVDEAAEISCWAARILITQALAEARPKRSGQTRRRGKRA